jgi:hypothetical protein
MADVFISYGRDDIEFTRQLAKALMAQKFTVWFDQNLRTGQNFGAEIEAELRGARAVVVVWSKSSVQSNFVYAEAMVGYKTKKLLPIRIDHCEPPLPFGTIQRADLTQWRGETAHDGMQRLLSGLNFLVGSPADHSARHSWEILPSSFEWTGATIVLRKGSQSRTLRYKNHFEHESVYLDNVEVCRAGNSKQRHRMFQFYIDDPIGTELCFLEPRYGLTGGITGRLAGLSISIGRLNKVVSR